MFFFLSKFLPVFIYPIGLTISLIVVGIILWRWRKLQTAVLGIAILLLFLASNQYIANTLAKTLEWQYFPPDPIPQVDMIIVLGGMTRWSDAPQPVPNLNEAGDRLLYAAWLYQQGVADKLLLTGGQFPGATQAEAVVMRDALLVMGVPESAMILETESLNTYQNALFAKPILDEMNVNSALLVTSATHMPRSQQLFAKMDIPTVPAPTDYFVVAPKWDDSTKPTPSSLFLGMLPSATALTLTTKVIKEYVGILIYGWRGWL